MKKTLCNTFVLLIALSCVGHASAQIINFAVAGYDGDTYNGIGPAPDIATTEEWNEITPTGSNGQGGTTSFNVTSTGASTNVTFTNEAGLADEDINYFPPVNNLLYSYEYSYSPPVTGTLNNVSPGTYDLYLVSQNGSYANTGAVFTLNGVSQTVTNSGTNTGTFIDGENYTEFTNVTPVNGTISFSFTTNTGSITYNTPSTSGDPEVDFNGVQLVATPEPSTYLLMALGASALLVIARNRRVCSLLNSITMG